MVNVDRLLAENQLEDDAARAFQEGRVRVSERHGNWRANFPAIGLLLDGDEERAQALAGNYATEAREIVGVWLAAQESSSPAVPGVEASVAWIGAYWQAWRVAVFEIDEVAALDGAPRDRFVAIFDELSERFGANAVEFVRSGGTTSAAPHSVGAGVAGSLRRFARAIESFFFPSVRG